MFIEMSAILYFTVQYFTLLYCTVQYFTLLNNYNEYVSAQFYMLNKAAIYRIL